MNILMGTKLILNEHNFIEVLCKIGRFVDFRVRAMKSISKSQKYNNFIHTSLTSTKSPIYLCM